MLNKYELECQQNLLSTAALAAAPEAGRIEAGESANDECFERARRLERRLRRERRANAAAGSGAGGWRVTLW